MCSEVLDIGGGRLIYFPGLGSMSRNVENQDLTKIGETDMYLYLSIFAIQSVLPESPLS